MPSSPVRRSGLYARKPLTYSSGTTPGEQLIQAATTAPTVVGDGFELAGTDSNAGDARYAAPRYMDLIFELIDDGTNPQDEQLNVSVWFYFPDAGSTNKWRETAPFTVSGVNKRGAVGADSALDPAGNVYKVDVPQAASRAFVHIATLTADVHLRVLAYPDN